jgi:hypothetical protein
MTDQDNEEKQNMRIMWIASGVIVAVLLGIMGVSMLNDKGTGPTEMSSQSRPAPTGKDCSRPACVGDSSGKTPASVGGVRPSSG